MKMHAIFTAVLFVVSAVLDVAMDTNDEELAALRGVQKKASDVVKQETPSRHSRRLNILTNNRWKNRVGDVVQVPYVIDPLYFYPDEIALIERNLQILADGTKVVQFVPRTSQSAYIHVVCKSR
jgi:hypothetical protein